MDSGGSGGGPQTPAPPLERSFLNDVSGGDPEFESELMRAFLRSTRLLLSDLSAAIRDGDAGSTGTCAHTLKGNCGALGAIPMAESCEALEWQAREGHPENFPAWLAEIEQRYATLRRFILENWKVEAA